MVRPFPSSRMDASSIAVGVVLEIDGDVIEDVSWLVKANDPAHINMNQMLPLEEST